MPGRKRPLEERLEHFAAIEQAMVRGRSTSEIIAACQKKFGLDRMTVLRDMKVVKSRWERNAARIKAAPGEQVGKAVARRELLFNLAVESMDFDAALKADQDRVKLLGLYPAEKGEDAAGAGRATGPDYSAYRRDPNKFCRDVLGVKFTPDQERLSDLAYQPPYRLMVETGHNIGKSFWLACLTIHRYACYNPGVVITTAPTDKASKDVLWAEIRLAVRRAKLAYRLPPKDTFVDDGEDHWIKGYTASSGEAFQGRHREFMMLGYDEAEGIDPVYWTAGDSMFVADGNSIWIGTLNPTTTSSQAYMETQIVLPDGTPKWRVERMSALDHPNVRVGLANRERAKAGQPLLPLPVASAVKVEQVEEWIGSWFEPVDAEDVDPDLDVEFPPGSGKWHRPGPDGEARVLGRRPTAGTYGVWTERLWKRAGERSKDDPANPQLKPGVADLPEIGCDVARYGTDRTEIHVRVGPCSFHHEDHQGWDTVRTADRLADLADWWARWATRQRDPNAAPIQANRIKIKVDDTGVGGGVTDILNATGKLSVIPVNASETANASDRYPSVRDELWFTLKELAKAGKLDLSRLDAKRRAKLQVQALAPVWAPTADRRRRVEPKEQTVKRLGYSPDGLDAINLSYYSADALGFPELIDTSTHR